jgi:hypothetical protein
MPVEAVTSRNGNADVSGLTGTAPEALDTCLPRGSTGASRPQPAMRTSKEIEELKTARLEALPLIKSMTLI